MELDSSAFSATGSGCALAQEALFMRYEAKILELQRQIDKLSSDLYDKKKQLDRVTHYLESLLKNISEGLILISHTGMITTYNTAAEKILGIKQKEVLFTNFSETFLDNTFGFSMSYALKKLDSAEIHVTKYLYKGLYEKELEISKSAVCTRARTHRGIILVLRDITRQRQEIRKEQQNKRMQELGQLAATVAHEVRNPLGGIEGFASLLQSDLKVSHPSLSQMAGYIVEGSRTISNLIENVLRSARPLCPQPQEVNIVALVEEVKKHVEVDPYFSKEITLYHAPYQPTLHIIADKLMLRSCLLHLIRNAFQAIETKGSVHITVFTKADHALITVKDSGCGIAKEHIERLFSPFFTTKEKGTGLGLYETYRMIQCHGGSIEVKSSPECGTLFILSLPIKGYLS